MHDVSNRKITDVFGFVRLFKIGIQVLKNSVVSEISFSSYLVSPSRKLPELYTSFVYTRNIMAQVLTKTKQEFWNISIYKTFLSYAGIHHILVFVWANLFVLNVAFECITRRSNLYSQSRAWLCQQWS
jgi:hypothetical protein